MKKVLLLTLPIIFGVVGCASTTPPTTISKSANAIAFQNMEPKQYQLNEVKIKLQSKVKRDGYLTDENIQQQYTNELNKYLKLQSKNVKDNSVEPALVNVEVSHKRVFGGEDLPGILGKKLVGGFAHTELYYTMDVTYKGEVVDHFVSSKLIGIGKYGAFGKIARDLSGQGGPQHELEDVGAISNLMIEKLKK